jgi:AraC family transcriptional regulator
MATELLQIEAGPRFRLCSADRSMVEQAIHGMRSRLDEDFTLRKIVEGTGLGAFQFLRIFRRLTGLPPGQFLSALRLEEAKRLLLSTERSVGEICFEVGYNSVGTFTSRFTQWVGLSPTRLRQLGRGFRCETLAQLPRQTAGPAPAGRFDVTGQLLADVAPGQLLFLGLFDHAIPEGKPLACELLAAPGPFRLRAPRPGRCHLFAASFEPLPDPLDFLLGSRAVRQVGSRGPLAVRDGGVSCDLRLRAPQLFDPPLLIALPLLVSERLAA